MKGEEGGRVLWPKGSLSREEVTGQRGVQDRGPEHGCLAGVLPRAPTQRSSKGAAN